MPKEYYEYMRPHGTWKPSPSSKQPKPSGPLSRWQVEVPWGSEIITRTVSADGERKALNKVLVDLAKSVNLPMNTIFRRVNGEKKYTVTKLNSTFVSRAGSFATPASDLERIMRLPYVESAILYEKNGNTVTYRAMMKPGKSLVQNRELTGYIQNLFGPRLLSSGPTQMKDSLGNPRGGVEVRVSLLTVV